jgi:hypothetical protein
MAPALAAFLGLDYIVEEWRPVLGLLPGALHLTNVPMEGGTA